MKKIVIICGLISGVIVSSMMAVSISMCYRSQNFDNGMIYGYTAMILAFSLILVGVKNYRDKYNNGVISFGKAFRIGLYITLIASSVYVAVWLVEYFFFVPDFADVYANHQINKMRTAGASQAEITKQAVEMAKFAKMYKNPFFNALMTYIEILPVGLLVSVISALILKRKPNKRLTTTTG